TTENFRRTKQNMATVQYRYRQQIQHRQRHTEQRQKANKGFQPAGGRSAGYLSNGDRATQVLYRYITQQHFPQTTEGNDRQIHLVLPAALYASQHPTVAGTHPAGRVFGYRYLRADKTTVVALLIGTAAGRQHQRDRFTGTLQFNR